MTTTPKKKCKVAGIAFLLCAAACGGAAFVHARSSRPGLAVMVGVLAVFYFALGVLLLKRSKQP